MTEDQFKQLIARLDVIAGARSEWLTQEEAMNIIGCRRTKMVELRMRGAITWRYAGQGKGVRISRDSVERFVSGEK
jgi:hypothetical protein